MIIALVRTSKYRAKKLYRYITGSWDYLIVAGGLQQQEVLKLLTLF